MVCAKVHGLLMVTSFASLVNAYEHSDLFHEFETHINHPNVTEFTKKFCECVLDGYTNANCFRMTEEKVPLPHLTEYDSKTDPSKHLIDVHTASCEQWLEKQMKQSESQRLALNVSCIPACTQSHEMSSCFNIHVVLITLMSLQIVLLVAGFAAIGIYFNRYTQKVTLHYPKDFENSLL